MKKDETYVHIAVRNFLKDNGWKLIAGQYPGGSDDELHTVNIYDPVLARDGSPDHRRHSFGKLVPDLIAYKNKVLLVIEAKPEYSHSDKEKLQYTLKERRADFILILTKFAEERDFQEILPLDKLEILPALAYLKEFSPSVSDDIIKFQVIDLNVVEVNKSIVND